MSEFALRSRTVLLACALLLGCTIPRPGQVRAGMTAPEVVALMGPATARYTMPGGATRLEFATGPSGRVTWMVDLDAGGLVTQAEQVLDVRHFLLITDGMDREIVLRVLGQPSFVRGESMQRETWYWRYDNHDCLIGAATLSPQGRVVGGVGQMNDPACDRRTS